MDSYSAALRQVVEPLYQRGVASDTRKDRLPEADSVKGLGQRWQALVSKIGLHGAGRRLNSLVVKSVYIRTIHKPISTADTRMRRAPSR